MPTATVSATEKRFVNIRELSRLVGLSDRTLQEMYRNGGMPHIRAGRAVRFDPERVLQWFEQHHGQNCE